MLEVVIASWQASPTLHSFRPGASLAEIAEAEGRLGRPLPASLRELYVFSNGGGFLEGNLTLEPLQGSKEFEGLDRLTDDLLGTGPHGWPPELLVFGGNGSDNLFAAWIPPDAEASADTPVIAAVHGDKVLALAGTSLAAFLAGWSAYYLMLYGAPEEALDQLRLPSALRRLDFDDEHFAAVVRWADPDLDPARWDPYEAPVDASELRRRFG